jgi:hypothetical protein
MAAACGLLLAPAMAAAQVAPTGDVLDTFAGDPRSNPAWVVRGPWSWDPGTGALISGKTLVASAISMPGLHYTGSFSVRLNLISGRLAPARARIVFARNAATGAYRYVEVRSGAPGAILIGQAGTIRAKAPGVFAVARKTIALNSWHDVTVVADGYNKVSAFLDGQLLVTASTGPRALGAIGLMAMTSKVAFDSFSFTADPDGEPCAECHAGQASTGGLPPAPNVYTYWDGSWWKQTQGAAAGQHGGHGDPGGLFAMGCTGGSGCHTMRLPSPGDHRNGVVKRGAAMTENPFHLRATFIADSPAGAQDVQMTFDNTCATACHQGYGVANMRHMGVTANRPFLQLGYGLTDATGATVPADMPLAAALTSRAPAQPVFATCVTCHDPHGTAVTDQTGGSNHMVRRAFVKNSDLCLACHR